MKSKNTFLLFFLIVIFVLKTHAQRLEWSASLSANYTYFGLEDDLFQEPPLNDPIQLTYSYYDKYDIKRIASAKMGFGLGTNLKIKVMDNFFVVTGIESQLIRFEKLEWIKKVVDGEPTNFSPPQEGTPFNGIEGGTINRRVLWESYQNYSSNIPYASSENGLSINQKLMYLKIPLNVGFSTNSKKWMVYTGLWYGRLIGADFGIDKSIDGNHKVFFNKNSVGVNLGLQIRVLKNISATLNYSNFGDNIYAQKNILEDNTIRYLDSSSRNQFLDSNKHHQYFLGISYTFYTLY